MAFLYRRLFVFVEVDGDRLALELQLGHAYAVKIWIVLIINLFQKNSRSKLMIIH